MKHFFYILLLLQPQFSNAIDWESMRPKIMENTNFISENKLTELKDKIIKSPFSSARDYYNLAQIFYLKNNKNSAKLVINRGRKLFPSSLLLKEGERFIGPITPPLNIPIVFGFYSNFIIRVLLWLMIICGMFILFYKQSIKWKIGFIIVSICIIFCIMNISIFHTPSIGLATKDIITYWGDSTVFEKGPLLNKGNSFVILKIDGGWIRIMTENNNRLWIPPQSAFTKL
ncbi:hypothetical protein [Spirochaeta cellobiosiphila]|uniref:hypothetical protein n=1 Tax=Spirochaeta cellobiosiphila TaxID=504483 RepID=UPI00041B7F7F|nr:hypothetical protein [Spirochaeta cellobiosiphila]